MLLPMSNKKEDLKLVKGKNSASLRVAERQSNHSKYEIASLVARNEMYYNLMRLL